MVYCEIWQTIAWTKWLMCFPVSVSNGTLDKQKKTIPIIHDASTLHNGEKMPMAEQCLAIKHCLFQNQIKKNNTLIHLCLLFCLKSYMQQSQQLMVLT